MLLSALISLGAQSTSSGFEDYDDDYEWHLMEGEGLTILGSISTTQQMETVDRETIEKINATDIPSLLGEALGLGVIRYGPYGNTAGVNLRGFDVKRIAVLVDGIPANSTASGNVDFYAINPLSIEKIEVIYGGSDTRFNVSGALGGVINIITVRKPEPGWSLGGSFANTAYIPGEQNGNTQWQDLADSQSINLSFSYRTGNYSLNIGVFGNRVGNHFLYRDYFDFIRRKEGNEVFDAGAAASFVLDFGAYSKLIAAGSFYYSDKNIPTSGYAVNYIEQNDFASRANIMLDMPRAFHDDFGMELAVSHNHKKSQHDSAMPSIHTENDLNAIMRWAWYPAKNFTLRFGGDYRFISIDSTNTGLHYANRGGLYITPEFTPTEKLLLIASVKGISDGREIVPIPKLGLLWALSDRFTIRNNYFRSFKFPDFDDLYWEEAGFTGNPNLKNEDGWGADLGIDFSVKNLFTVNSTIYGQWTNDSIHWSNMSGTWQPENYGQALFIGWDNRVNLVLPASFGPFEKLTLGLSWLLQMSRLLTGDLTFGDDKHIPYMPLHSFSITLEVPWKTTGKNLPGSLLIQGNFTGSRYTDTANSNALDPYFLLNITYNQKLGENLGVFGKINNALNTTYFSFNQYPMPGISIVMGMNVFFEGSSE